MRFRAVVLVAVAAALGATATAGCGGPSAAARASMAGIRIVRFDLHSRMIHRTVPEIGLVPAASSATPPGARRPMLVFLHGRNGTPRAGSTPG
jgi:hypothetical protein